MGAAEVTPLPHALHMKGIRQKPAHCPVSAHSRITSRHHLAYNIAQFLSESLIGASHCSQRRCRQPVGSRHGGTRGHDGFGSRQPDTRVGPCRAPWPWPPWGPA